MKNKDRQQAATQAALNSS